MNIFQKVTQKFQKFSQEMELLKYPQISSERAAGNKRCDYTRAYWGHSVEITNRKEVDIVLDGEKVKSVQYSAWVFYGFGSIRIGDEILLKMQKGDVAVMRVIKCERMSDPNDMYNVEMILIAYLMTKSRHDGIVKAHKEGVIK